jgi:hypothetical protein
MSDELDPKTYKQYGLPSDIEKVVLNSARTLCRIPKNQMVIWAHPEHHQAIWHWLKPFIKNPKRKHSKIISAEIRWDELPEYAWQIPDED